MATGRFNPEVLLALDKANLVAHTTLPMSADTQITLRWKIPLGSLPECREWSEANRRSLSDFTVESKDFDGTWRSLPITTDNIDKVDREGITFLHTFAKGYITTLLVGGAVNWTEARLVNRRELPIGNTLNAETDLDNNPEAYVLIRWTGIEPSVMHAVAAELEALSPSGWAPSFMAKATFTGLYRLYCVASVDQAANDRSASIELLLAKPTFALISFDMRNSVNERKEMRLYNVPKYIAQETINTFNRDVDNSSAEVSNETDTGLFNIVIRSSVQEESDEPMVGESSCAFVDYVTFYFSQEAIPTTPENSMGITIMPRFDRNGRTGLWDGTITQRYRRTQSTGPRVIVENQEFYVTETLYRGLSKVGAVYSSIAVSVATLPPVVSLTTVELPAASNPTGVTEDGIGLLDCSESNNEDCTVNIRRAVRTTRARDVYYGAGVPNHLAEIQNREERSVGFIRGHTSEDLPTGSTADGVLIVVEPDIDEFGAIHARVTKREATLVEDAVIEVTNNAFEDTNTTIDVHSTDEATSVDRTQGIIGTKSRKTDEFGLFEQTTTTRKAALAVHIADEWLKTAFVARVVSRDLHIQEPLINPVTDGEWPSGTLTQNENQLDEFGLWTTTVTTRTARADMEGGTDGTENVLESSAGTTTLHAAAAEAGSFSVGTIRGFDNETDEFGLSRSVVRIRTAKLVESSFLGYRVSAASTTTVEGVEHNPAPEDDTGSAIGTIIDTQSDMDEFGLYRTRRSETQVIDQPITYESESSNLLSTSTVVKATEGSATVNASAGDGETVEVINDYTESGKVRHTSTTKLYTNYNVTQSWATKWGKAYLTVGEASTSGELTSILGEIDGEVERASVDFGRHQAKGRINFRVSREPVHETYAVPDEPFFASNDWEIEVMIANVWYTAHIYEKVTDSVSYMGHILEPPGGPDQGVGWKIVGQAGGHRTGRDLVNMDRNLWRVKRVELQYPRQP